MPISVKMIIILLGCRIFRATLTLYIFFVHSTNVFHRLKDILVLGTYWIKLWAYLLEANHTKQSCQNFGRTLGLFATNKIQGIQKR